MDDQFPGFWVNLPGTAWRAKGNLRWDAITGVGHVNNDILEGPALVFSDIDNSSIEVFDVFAFRNLELLGEALLDIHQQGRVSRATAWPDVHVEQCADAAKEEAQQQNGGDHRQQADAAGADG